MLNAFGGTKDQHIQTNKTRNNVLAAQKNIRLTILDYLKRKRPKVQVHNYLNKYVWTDCDLTNNPRGAKWKSDQCRPIGDRLDAFGNLENP